MLDNERIEIIMYYIRCSESVEIKDEKNLHNAIALSLYDISWTDGMTKKDVIEEFSEKHQSFINRIKNIWYRFV